MNNKGQSVGFAWIYGLIMLFGLGLIYIVFNQVFVGNLVPIIKAQVNDTVNMGRIDSATGTQIYAGIDRYMTYFQLLPYILFLVVVIFMIVAIFKKEPDSDFG